MIFSKQFIKLQIIADEDVSSINNMINDINKMLKENNAVAESGRIFVDEISRIDEDLYEISLVAAANFFTASELLRWLAGEISSHVNGEILDCRYQEISIEEFLGCREMHSELERFCHENLPQSIAYIRSVLGQTKGFRRIIKECYQHKFKEKFIDLIDEIYNTNNYPYDIFVVRFPDDVDYNKYLETLAVVLYNNGLTRSSRVDVYEADILTTTDEADQYRTLNCGEFCTVAIVIQSGLEEEDYDYFLSQFNQCRKTKLVFVVANNGVRNFDSPNFDKAKVVTIDLTKDGYSLFDDEFSKQDKAVQSSNELIAEVCQDIIGLAKVKQQLKSYIDIKLVNKRRSEFNLPTIKLKKHLAFIGPSGVGKTTMAQKLTELFFHLGEVSDKHCKLLTRNDLVGEHIGETAIRTRDALRIFESEHGKGVILIDEAYTLASDKDNKRDFGRECIAEILTEIDRDDCRIIIFAGYPAEMRELLDYNPGLRSRVTEIFFDAYSVDELVAIFDQAVTKYKLNYPESEKEKLRLFFDRAKLAENFGNGRFVAKYLEEVMKRYALRISELSEVDEDALNNLVAADLNLDEEILKLKTKYKTNKIKLEGNKN